MDTLLYIKAFNLKEEYNVLNKTNESHQSK